MAQALREIIRSRLEERFVGRRKEIETLLRCLENDGPLVLHVHGFAGIGKTTLLRRFALEVEHRDGAVISLDCRDIEPTERGFLAALAEATGAPSLKLSDLATSLATGDNPFVLLLDDYQNVFLADTWVRNKLLPALPANARVVIGSREPPLPGWLFAPEWRRSFNTVVLGPFSEAEALEFAERAGLQPDQARAANRLALGHPLALELAVIASTEGTSRVEELSLEAALQRLADLHLREIRDVTLREALQAASVVRRVTVPLLSALLPGADAASLYDRLQSLPYVDAASDGLLLHAAVQKALATSLHASDPERYRRYREAAWRRLRWQSRSAGIPDMWRYTADMLYLVENQWIREAFFPTALEPLSTEDATASDWPAIDAIAARHETPAARTLVEKWWQQNPGTFKVMRSAAGGIRGFYVFAEPSSNAAAPGDPLFDAWERHLREQPVARHETVVFLRRWLSDGEGELPSPVQGGCWLNVKQSYMGLRPSLRRCYIAVTDLQTYGPVATTLGFHLVDGASTDLDGVTHHLAVLDLGPGSVDGWLSGHIASELGLDEAGILDLRSRELVLDGARIHLTPLEFETMRYLVAHRGQAVTRSSLLESVWGYDFVGDSNVVDTLIAGLRRKLKDRAALVETVWGVGYRLREEAC